MSRTPSPKRNRATLSDIAEATGLSPTTVSLVLSGNGERLRIAPETLERVKKAAKELSYTPNLVYRSIRQGRTQIISFYSAFRHRDVADSYMEKLATAVEYAAGKVGYDVLAHCNYRRKPRQVFEFLNGGWADGLLLFAPLPNDPLLPLLRRSSLPTVLMNARDESKAISSVKDDVEGGMRLVAESLVLKGHSRIVVAIEQGDTIRDAHERLSLLRSNLAVHGIQIRDDFIIPFGGGFLETLLGLLERPDGPTAVFAYRDFIAYYILENLEHRGIRIPNELSIIGYDGIHWPCMSSHIAASVKVDLYDLAAKSVELLDSIISGKQSRFLELTQPVSFDPGTTFGPAKTSP